MVLTFPDWMLDAPCSHRPDLDWFDLDCGLHEATKVCDACPFRSRCLDYAVEHGMEDGVWGGLWGEQLVRMVVGRVRTARNRARG